MSTTEVVERSPYKIVFKFNRENKRFERAKVKSGRHVGVPQTGSNMASRY